jgi:hypothetical protein
MIRHPFATILVLIGPAAAFAGDGTFGVPASGILPPPTQTAALTQPADLPRAPAAQRVSRSHDIPTIREPAADAGRSRPAVEPVRSAPQPVIRKRGQSKSKPRLTVDPYYLANVTRDVRTEPPRAIEQAPPAIYPQPQPLPQEAAPRRGLFSQPDMMSRSASAAAYEEHARLAQPAMPAGAAAPRVAPDGTPCYQLRGLFTSPEHCR